MLPWAEGQGSGVPGPHLALHKHGHVHKHIVQLTNAVLQFNDLTVPCLNFTQGLLRDAGVHDDLGMGAVSWDPGTCKGGGNGDQDSRKPTTKAARMGSGLCRMFCKEGLRL